MSVGNSWTYLQEINNNSIQLTHGVEGDTIIDGHRWYKYYCQSNIERTRLLYSNSEQGVLNFLSLYHIPILRYKYPANQGDFFLFNYEGDTLFVIGINEKISTPIGVFSCVSYQQVIYSVGYGSVKPSINFITEYVSPGIGLVKSETSFIDSLGINQVLSSVLLTSFNIK
jgi:hypothetical protein